MAVALTVNGVIYQYPQSRDAAGWGDQATLWAQSVTNALSNVTSPNDISPSSNVTLNNNVTSATNINGLSFDPTQVRAAVVEYYIYRIVTGTSPSELIESGHLYLNYKSVAASWECVRVGAGDASVVITVTSAGQVQYTSSNLTVSGGSHTGVMKFRARALNQT